MKIVLIDYGSGNLRSCEKAFLKVCLDKNIKSQIVISNNPQDIKNADKIILPGVGAFADCMKGLCKIKDMEEALKEAVLIKKTPFLGICVGMQLLADTGFEYGNHTGLGWISGQVVKITSNNNQIKIPHMGWNNVAVLDYNPLFKNIENNAHFYFVHSYHFKCNDNKNIIAEVEYGQKIAAAIIKDNIVGVQFHPEKSQKNGQKFIENFIRWQ